MVLHGARLYWAACRPVAAPPPKALNVLAMSYKRRFVHGSFRRVIRIEEHGLFRIAMAGRAD